MKDIQDKEIRKVRLRLIDLIKSFFVGEPDAEKMSRWRGTFSAMMKETVNPLFDQSVRDIHQYLENHSLSELQDEYYNLFVDPFAGKQISTDASFYLDGRSHGKTLVALRTFLAELGIEKMENVIETEDSLVVMLDVMSRLIDEEQNSEAHDALRMQGELLEKYLIPLANSLQEACGKNESAAFYQACCRFFKGYLELEKGLNGAVVSH